MKNELKVIKTFKKMKKIKKTEKIRKQMQETIDEMSKCEYDVKLKTDFGGLAMAAYKDRSREELLELKSQLEQEFQKVKAEGLQLDMSRGKPSAAQLDLAMGMMDVLTSDSDLKCEEGVDCRNYGVLDGIREAKTASCRYDGGSKKIILLFLYFSQSEYYVRHDCTFDDTWSDGKYAVGKIR